MSFINIEIKARTGNAEGIRRYLLGADAEFKGTDIQTDTYFNTRKGRLKFHLDTLDQLGSFVEIEASNKYAPLSTDELKRQCSFYMQQFGIAQPDLIDVSYSDLLLNGEAQL